MHILNNTWISEFWYVFLVLIGLVISIIFYVHHKRKAFKQSLLLLLSLCLFSFAMHTFVEPNLESTFGVDGLETIHEDHFGTAPDYLGKGVERLYEFIRKFL